MTLTNEHLQLLLELNNPTPRFATPGDIAKLIDPNTNQTPALRLIDQALINLTKTNGGRLIISMPPQQGKSTRVAQAFPIWALTQNPNLPIVVASYGEALAERNGETIRNHIANHSTKLGLTLQNGSTARKRWRLNNASGGVLAAGIGTGLTGWACGLLIIDDPIKDRQEANSLTYRDRVWSWWRDVAQTRLAPGAPVVMILTRWHEDDLAGRMLAAPDGHRWQVLNIPAQAETNNDPLGRQPGEYLESARRHTNGQPMSREDWERIKTAVGSQTWAALYQGHPAPAEGGLIKRTWWKTYQHPPVPDTIIQSWDMTFKGGATSDFVVGQIWATKGAQCYLLDQTRGRWSFTETLAQFRLMAQRWPIALTKLVEDKANGTAIIDTLRNEIPGIIPVEPQGGKEARAAAITPLIEAGNVYLPETDWAKDLIEEAANFPNAAHDDQVDAMSQALTYLHITQHNYGTTFYNIG